MSPPHASSGAPTNQPVSNMNSAGFSSWAAPGAWVESASKLALCFANLAVGFGLGYLYALNTRAETKIEREEQKDIKETQASDATRVTEKEEKGMVKKNDVVADGTVKAAENWKGEKVLDQNSQLKITSLLVYPIKACAGMEVSTAKVTDRGLENDRLFMIVDFSGRSVTQKKNPKLTLVKPQIEGNILVIQAPGMKPLRHTIKKWGTKKEVTHLNAVCEAIDQGDEAGKFFNEFLGEQNLRLVRMREGFVRSVIKRKEKVGNFQTSFSDAWPYLLANEESLKRVGEEVGKELEMSRFRPNVVIGGEVEPFDEDSWKRLAVGEKVEFELADGCVRCKVVTVDPATGQFGSDNQPTEALKRIRSFGKTVVFGRNMAPTKNSRGKADISIGDAVQIVEKLQQVPKPNMREHIAKDSSMLQTAGNKGLLDTT